MSTKNLSCKKQQAIDILTHGKISTEKFWKDLCQHPKESYVGSIATPANDLLDVYVFVNELGKQELCIRHGSENNAYYSPGTIEDFVTSSRYNPIYEVALYLIKFFGEIKWSRTTTTKKKN